MPVSNLDPQQLPKALDTLNDQDVQERRLRTIRRSLFAILDEVRRLDEEVEPKRIAAITGGAATYQTNLTNLRTDIVAAVGRLDTIDAIA